MAHQPFETKAGAGPNGEELMIGNDALYEALKTALLGTGSLLITNGQTDGKFLRAQKMRLDRHPNPKVGHWIRVNEDVRGRVDVLLEPVQRSDQIDYCPAYTTKMKFIPPVQEDALQNLLKRFRQEFHIEDSRRDIDRQRPASRLGIQYRPGQGSDTGMLSEVNIDMPESEFKKIEEQVLAASRARA